MKKTTSLIVRLLLCIGLFVTVAAQKVSNLPVTSSIEGFGVNTSPTLRVQSDQNGTYKNSKSVQSIIQPIGAWVLDTNYSNSSTRAMLIDFQEPIAGSAPDGASPVAPFAYQLVKARLISKCNEYGVNPLNMVGIGSTLTCPLAVRFDYGGSSYRVVMNFLNYAETNPVTLTCDGVATPANPTTSKCAQWRIEPSVIQNDGQRKCIGKLLKLASSNNLSDQDLGNFYFSFTFHLTNP